ncbi:hypothetical protein P3S68_032329 [Capsicum galapagoense]
MEPMGAFLDEEYSQSLSKMFFTENSSDFMFQLHDDHPYIEGSSFSSPNSHTFNNSNNIDYFSQENSIDSRGSDGRFFLNNNNSTTHEYLQHCNDIESTNFYMMDHKNLENSSFNQDSHDDYVMQEMVSLKEDMGHNVQLDNEILLKRKFDQVELQSVTEDQKLKDSENPKKKSKVSRDHGPKNKNSQPKAKKKQKNIQMNNEEVGEKETNNNATNCQSGQSTSSCSSEDDSNVGTDLKPKQGLAEGLQQIHRVFMQGRERINERLRILQNLVPNGTKVDISTMLEEAVHYVKFLQIQIKLLSSDDMWMYAPIAYNGMGIDLSNT